MMSDLRKAAKQALGCLVRAEALYGQSNADVQAALRAALEDTAQTPANQSDTDGITVRYDLSPVETETAIRQKLIEMGWTPPAQTPPPRTPLTAEQVRQIWSEAGYAGATAQEKADFINGFRHAEIAHGITGSAA